MSLKIKFQYWQRIIAVYILRRPSQLSFWHEKPAINSQARFDQLGPYYMTFGQKSDYQGVFDQQGVPMLDYHGQIGRQYNPIAIAQYGLAHYNLMHDSNSVFTPPRCGASRLGGVESDHRQIFLRQANWLVDNLEPNQQGLFVWQHHFDFEYRQLLRAPWASALAQGQGVSVLVRAWQATGQAVYLEKAKLAFLALTKPIRQGGLQDIDHQGGIWLEEYLVSPTTHILNGFIWALWGVYDFWLATKDEAAKDLFADCVITLIKNLSRYDMGFWSRYDLSKQAMAMLASPFYHRLHLVQLKIMADLTKQEIFGEYHKKWQAYQKNPFYCLISFIYKMVFKLIYF